MYPKGLVLFNVMKLLNWRILICLILSDWLSWILMIYALLLLLLFIFSLLFLAISSCREGKRPRRRHWMLWISQVRRPSQLTSWTEGFELNVNMIDVIDTSEAVSASWYWYMLLVFGQLLSRSCICQNRQRCPRRTYNANPSVQNAMHAPNLSRTPQSMLTRSFLLLG